jgi:hypothetical protein
MRFGRMPRGRDEIEAECAEVSTEQQLRTLLLETLLDLRDLVAECAWRLSDLVDQKKH